MKTRIVLFMLLFILGSHAVADEKALTPDELKKVEAAKAAALKEPEVKAATLKYNAARKAYQIDRDKFPAERSPEIATAFRKATKELDDATRKAILARDATLAPLLDKLQAKGTLNEGETVADSDSAKNPAVRPIKDMQGLPRVLLIGDSISIGYTLPVRELLKGKANVHRIPVNGGATDVGLAKMKDWLGDGKWDVIHFNFGLHDAKYLSETTQRATREQYEKNLRTLVEQMKATGAKLIFATTTPVPNDGMLSPTRKFDSIPERNKIAVRAMKELGVAIDDLYAVVLPVQEKVGRANDVHYSPEGYEVLAKAVAESIAAALPDKKSTLLVAHKWDDSVGFYNVTTGKEEQVVPIGRRPHELTLSGDGKRAYITLYGLDLYTETAEGGKAVAVLDVTNRKKLGEIELGKYRRPHGIERGHKSNLLYITCDHPAALLVLDPDKSTVVTAIELSDPKSLPHMVAVAPDEKMAYVANCGTADVAVIDLSARKEVTRIAVGGVPMGMALSHDGRTLWATTRTSNGVAVIDTQKRKLERIIEVTGQPVRAALTPDGSRLLVTLIDSGEAAIIDAREGTLLKRVAIGRRVEGLTVDAAGEFGYASAQADDKVVRFSIKDGKPVQEISTRKRPDPLVILP